MDERTDDILREHEKRIAAVEKDQAVTQESVANVRSVVDRIWSEMTVGENSVASSLRRVHTRLDDMMTRDQHNDYHKPKNGNGNGNGIAPTRQSTPDPGGSWLTKPIGGAPLWIVIFMMLVFAMFGVNTTISASGISVNSGKPAVASVPYPTTTTVPVSTTTTTYVLTTE